MKFLTLGYMAEETWESMPKAEQEAMVVECHDYDSDLIKNGHWLEGGQAMEHSSAAKILRWKDGKVVVTDGPFTETKEQLGGIGMLEAESIEQAVELLRNHPSLRYGITTEIRPIDEETLCRQKDVLDQTCQAAAAISIAKTASMKFAVLGLGCETIWDSVMASELDAMLAECVAFDQERINNGQWQSGIKLQSACTAKTLRPKSGKVIVTDGPFAETKEQLGGLVINAFKDMRQAIEVLSTHPALRFGVVLEIRPINEEMTANWEDTMERAQKV